MVKKQTVGSMGESTVKEERAGFLAAHPRGSIEEAGYAFANADTEEDRREEWDTLMNRVYQRIERASQAAIDDGIADGRHEAMVESKTAFVAMLNRKRAALGYINVVDQCIEEMIQEVG